MEAPFFLRKLPSGHGSSLFSTEASIGPRKLPFFYGSFHRATEAPFFLRKLPSSPGSSLFSAEASVAPRKLPRGDSLTLLLRLLLQKLLRLRRQLPRPLGILGI